MGLVVFVCSVWSQLGAIGSPERSENLSTIADGARILAYAALDAGHYATARDLLDEAASVGQRLGHDGNHLWTAFGPTNVAVHHVSAALERGDGGTAVKFATAVRPTQLPVLERRAHHLLDIARGYGM